MSGRSRRSPAMLKPNNDPRELLTELPERTEPDNELPETSDDRPEPVNDLPEPDDDLR